MKKTADVIGFGLAGVAREHGVPVPAEPVQPYAVWTLDDMMNLEPPDWAIEGVIPLGGRALLFAPSGHHKTNIAVDQGCHIGHGLEWHGLKVTSCPVIVVATEDAHGTSTRIAGWHHHHQRPAGRVIVVPGGEFRLNDPDSIARLKATAEAQFPGEKVGFIIDHYDVSMNGDPTATGEAVEAAKGLRELGDGAAFVLLLAHAPWTTDQRAKVPVALWANVDARLRCERDEVTGKATLTVLHQKNGPSGAVLRFEFERHAFETRRGAAEVLIAQRLLDDAGITPRTKKSDNLGDNEKLALQHLGAALADHAQDMPHARDMPRGVRGVEIEQWWEVSERYMPQGPTWRKRQAFDRAVKSLLVKHRIRHADGWVWLPKENHT